VIASEASILFTQLLPTLRGADQTATLKPDAKSITLLPNLSAEATDNELRVKWSRIQVLPTP
jgi:hypothetical protein